MLYSCKRWSQSLYPFFSQNAQGKYSSYADKVLKYILFYKLILGDFLGKGLDTILLIFLHQIEKWIERWQSEGTTCSLAVTRNIALLKLLIVWNFNLQTETNFFKALVIIINLSDCKWL